ncbi:MAG: MFS transporter [Spirochaetes bacterium]|nr:MFS transporter [Spirochaetota bacterium]
MDLSDNTETAESSVLSRPEQIKAQRTYLSYAMFNPLGASLTIGPISTLLALYYGANNLQTGLLFASIYLAGVFAVVTPALFQGMDASRVTSRSWWIRSVIAGSILFFPFIPDASLKVWLLVGILFAFLSIRAVGISTIPSVLRTISGPRELTTMNAEAMLRWYFGCLITALLAWGVLSQRHRLGEENAFMILFGVGFMFNLVTSQRLSCLPQTGSIEGGSLRALKEAFFEVTRQRTYREVVWITLLQVPMAIAAAYQVNALRGYLGYTPEAITALTVVGLVVSVAGARALVLIGARIPVRPLLLGSHLFLFILGASWTWLQLFPAPIRSIIAAILFVLGTLFLAISGTVLAALSNERLPRDNAVSFSVIYQLAGVVAAILGIAAVQGLGMLAPFIRMPGLHPYSHSFFLWTVLSLGVCFFALVMAKGKFGLLARDIEQILPPNLLTVFRAHDVTVHASSQPSEVREFENVLVSHSPAGERLILEALRHPEARQRSAAFNALYENPLPSSLPYILAEADNQDSPLRGEAVNALGFLRVPAATDALRELVHDRNPDIFSKAYKGLLRHDVQLSDSTAFMKRYRSLRHTWHRLDMLWGLLAQKRSDLLWDIIAYEMSYTHDPVWIRSVFIILAESLGDDVRMSELFIVEREKPRAAFEELLAELPDPIAEASIREWRRVSAKGKWRLPANARFPRSLAPENITCLIGILHCCRLAPDTNS